LPVSKTIPVEHLPFGPRPPRIRIPLAPTGAIKGHSLGSRTLSGRVIADHSLAIASPVSGSKGKYSSEFTASSPAFRPLKI